MKPIVPTDIENYCRAHTTPLSSLKENLISETFAQTEFPEMLTGQLEGTLLRFLVQLSQARRVLEIGTFTGFSALCMAEGLPEDGELITCDINPESTRLAQKSWAQSPHGKKIQLKMGPALETIAELEGEFDLAFIDADKTNYIAYWQAVVPLIRKGGLIIVDNVLWSGRVLNPERESDHAIVAFNQHARQDSRVESVMLSIRDGMFLARKQV
ncbi:methyltransferase [bacterium (Candidatus Blackallbacteria) CG17_big_fil_post_rev_8_21_14_2_50_48_46]|uniref:Methyltransferase n=1 Tax=bacterium (Candidatus Blackallbacteria) CG17_big_fil_post_rev_8_21_14_2_50_48_46 TaxID=2014261 RepID=A0A2M7GA68_9BACT|nr:MAG: methyltransferase [bacterium (Candidatus Blackallbacteria) CG18_big_fil_WC_8_21_14_2_50_49_26]PIW19042.1 MAG: methyltransferase [bacterium (Candidatus Blackallbacteria) CG17_big_fil_post_rev_8_21_14_2_50_48_46]PIW44591.1 MAG: methyltransferase [bacterium (Candidatus Blackallbacteria) CG13_big_fil_rev_8_21_14_2_50_49_14]